MGLWIRYDPVRCIWEVSPNERDNYFSDLIENHPREVVFSKWIDFDSFSEAKPPGTFDDATQAEGTKRVRIYSEGELQKIIRRQKGRSYAWGPAQSDLPPEVAPAGRIRLYYDKAAKRFKFSSDGSAWQDVFVIERGGTVVNPNGITAAINIPAWCAPYAATVQSVKGYRVGGTGATINARKNGSSNHLSSALSLTSADTYMDGGAVQNASYAVGDKLEIMVVSATGSPTEIGIQVNFSRP